MGIFTEEIPKTSITFYIERLSNYEEIDWYIVQQLTESIQMQEGGPREAIEAMRKRLKHGTTQQKLRVIDVLKLLMENTSEKFHRQLLSNDKMRERLDLIVSSSTEDTKVRKALLSVLGAWAVKYKNEPGMHVLAELYESGRKKLNLPRRTGSGSAATTTTPRSPATAEATPAMPPRPTQQQQPSPPTSSQQKRQSLPPTAHTTEVRTKPRSSSTAGSGGNSSNNRTTTTQRTFNLEAAKPKIIQEVALANQNTNNLVNALKFINTSEDRWEIDLQHDARLQDYRQRCEDSKKKIVRYARLVEDEEWIGTLLATNEELLKALQMYETMSVGEVPTNMPSTPPSPLSPQHTRSPPPPPSQRQEETMRELAGLQLSSSSTSSPPPTTDSNLSRASAESENPFADPFADPVTPAHEDVGGDKKRLGELVL